MSKKLVLFAGLTIVLVGMLGMAIRVERVEASGTIYIKADGSIDPDTAPVSTTDNIVYTLSANIYENIVVQRNHIIIDGDGYSVQGSLNGSGVDLSFRSNVTIKNMKIREFRIGIFLWHSQNNIITGNIIDDNTDYCIQLYEDCTGTLIHGNTLRSTNIRIDIEDGVHTIHHNNFKVGYPGHTFFSSSAWDNGFEGNHYWEYAGTDPDHDGIGDSWYEIDENNIDHYPLMGMFSNFNTSMGDVYTICNSTISAFQFNGTAISFNVTGKDDTDGFCRICIPKTLMNDTFRVFVNGTQIPCTPLTDISNTTHTYLYFSYTHSTQEVIVIPELPSLMILPLCMMATLLATIVYRKKTLHEK